MNQPGSGRGASSAKQRRAFSATAVWRDLSARARTGSIPSSMPKLAGDRSAAALPLRRARSSSRSAASTIRCWWRLPASAAWSSTPEYVLFLGFIYLSNYYTLLLPRGKVRLQTSCSKGCQNPTPCWTRQIQARPNQPCARCSIFIPNPASRGSVFSGLAGRNM